MSSLAHSVELPRRSRWVKSRGVIGLLILTPILALAIRSGTHWRLTPWQHGFLDTAAWCGFVAGVGFRFWAAAYIGGRKGQAIATEGPYSICRNPLYFGSCLILAAFTLWLRSPVFLMGAIAASAVYLCMTVSDEERRLAHKFGPAYLIYCRETPRFWPRLRQLRTPDSVKVNVAAMARECRSAALYLWLPIVGRLLAALGDSTVP